jgi:alkanesulfonate monooxygenase SsuD/methylene tetrahydromethanopterin reductase-like flavin-dependent oxidoreductase (luciferase family)
MGGNAGPRSAALAARYADEYNTAFATVADARERRQRIIEACSHAQREPIPFSIMTGVLVGRDASELRDRARRLLARIGAGDDADSFLAEPPHGWIVGTVEQAIEQLSLLREAGVSRVMCQQLLHEDLDAVALLGDELAPRVA